MNTLSHTLLRKLVAIPSVTSQPAAREAVDFVADFLAGRGMHITRREYNGCPAFVATSRRTKTPAVMLAAHIDVVPGPAESYTVREEGNRLYGRGTMDMKAAIAAYMSVVDLLKHHLDDYDFGIMITSDEEQHGPSVANLLDEGFKPKMAILFDGGFGWQIEKAAKSAWCPLVSVTGKRAHGSRPWLGDSASFKLISLLNEIRALFNNDGHGGNTLNIGAIECSAIGVAPNQVPALARATLDMRIVGKDELARMRRVVGELCDKYGASLEEMYFFPPIEHDLSNPYLAEFKTILQEETGVHSDGFVALAVSDAVSFNAHNIPCAVTYPEGDNHHGDEEWVSKDAPDKLVAIVHRYLQKVAHTPVPSAVDEKPELALA